MTDESRNATSEKAPKDEEAAKLDPETQRDFRERVIKLAFHGDESAYNEFVKALADATPDGVQVILRGSAVTGHKHGSDEPFDHDGPGTSDLDVTFVGGNMVMLFRSFHIEGIHSAPLSKEHPFASPALGPLRERLCEMTGRAVNLQATTSLVQYLRDIVMDQPYLVLLDKRDAEKKNSD
ncbi:MAG TPA: hypothetical protein VNC11_16900 [Gemmatimonadaceae bacterium]|jgi:hypothetical protein|nr:hypothetical protein [Gemmatimonadaceae bacterium]